MASEADSDPALGFIPEPTPLLERMVAHLRKTLSPAEFDGLCGEIEKIYHQYVARLRAFAPGLERARELHRLMEKEMASVAHVEVSCRKGCSGCCHYEVEITEDEALLLREAVRGGIEIDRERLSRLALRERKSPEWAKLGVSENRCVFLDGEGACRVYLDRPASCRKYLVTSPAVLCSIVGASVDPVPILTAEVLLSAALGMEETRCDSLPKLLFEALGKD